MSTPYLGEIRLFAGNFAPLGWMFCDGQLLSIAEYDTLFTLIGTTYGGDGESTFALPDLRGRVPVHNGGEYIIGETGGVERVTLTQAQIPSHSHALLASTALGDQVNPAGKVPASGFQIAPYINLAPDTGMNGAAITAAGGSQPHDNLQPYLCVNYIISLYGVFPVPT